MNDRKLDRDDDEDRVDHQAVVRTGHALVEAQPEREPPRNRDQHGVGEQLPEAVPVDRHHDATGAAACTTETTRSCASASMPAQSGTREVLVRELLRDRAATPCAVTEIPRATAADAAASCSRRRCRSQPPSTRREYGRARASGRRTGGRRGRARPRAARRPRRGRARHNGRPPRAAGRSSRRARRGRCAAAPPGARRGASCSRSARSRPCRASRGSAASECARQARGSSVETSPPSPMQKRFFVG